MQLPSEIRRLDEVVVNRIAAGEVVQRPCAALKEMLENSIDAGSNAITITAKNGGMMFLQIQDNGHGIRKEDMRIVCERFTTSKLRDYDDLKTIKTFGFRGEALASITHVAHVSILTRTADSPCAYKAKYVDGKIVPLKPGDTADPKPSAGNVGTVITVEDLFFNMPTRKQAFKNHGEQYQRILDVVTRYSIHFGGRNVSFVCKKQGQTIPDLNTPNGSSALENIKIAFGAPLARELIAFDFTISPPSSSSKSDVREYDQYGDDDGDNLVGSLSCTVSGLVSNANYSSKKACFILFINDRLVESQSIRKAIESVYDDILPRHSHPFVYLSLFMPPENLDVNVHPTKKEVHFLFEDQLLEQVVKNLGGTLRSGNYSRTFYTQSMSSSSLPIIFDSTRNSSSGSGGSARMVSGAPSTGASGFDEEATFNVGADDMQGEDNSQPMKKSRIDNNDEGEIVEDGVFFSSGATAMSHAEPRNIASFSFSRHNTSTSSLSSSRLQQQQLKSAAAHVLRPMATSAAPAVAANKFVRTDHTLMRIDTYFGRASPSAFPPTQSPLLLEDFDPGAPHSDDREDITTFSDHPLEAVTAKTTLTRSTAQQCRRSNTQANIDMKSVGAFARKASGSGMRSAGDNSCACCPVVPVVPANDAATATDVADDKFDEERNSDVNVTNLRADGGIGSAYNKNNANGKNSNGTGGSGSMPDPRPFPFDIRKTRCQYASVRAMIDGIERDRHSGLETLLRHHSFVGFVDSTTCLLQYQTKLVLVDFASLSRRLFKELVIRQFGCCNRLRLPKPLSIRDLVKHAILGVIIDDPKFAGAKAKADAAADKAVDILLCKRILLSEYFSVCISNSGLIEYLPEILPGHKPFVSELPAFLLCLATDVDWDDEYQCFHSIADILGSFYAFLPDALVSCSTPDVENDFSVSPVNTDPIPPCSTESLPQLKRKNIRDIYTLTETSLALFNSTTYPALRRHLVPPHECAANGDFVQIAALEQLYKIFERC